MIKKLINQFLQTFTIPSLVFVSGLIAATPANANEVGFDLEIVVLGVAQDAGFPQIGCYEQRCRPAWKNANLQQWPTSLALVNHHARQLLLFEASPELPQQLAKLYEGVKYHPYSLRGVFLTHAHIGHYTGLMYFGHEAQGATKVPVYAMPRMREFLKTSGPWSQLVEFENILLKPLQPEQAVRVAGAQITPFLVPHRDEFSETVGFRIQGPNKSAVFIPDIDKWDKWGRSLTELVRENDYLFLDATFYTHGELPNRDMSKVPHPLVTDTMALLEELPKSEKSKIWFIHFNHTNPMLDEASDETKNVTRLGFNISRAGLRLPL